MPSLTFVLPHWIYWSALLLFPLFAMMMIRRIERRQATGEDQGNGVSLSVAYLFLVTGGFVGLHRFYLSSRAGFLFLPLFVGILFANIEYRESREALSRVHRDLLSAEFLVERAERRLSQGRSGAAAQLEKAKRELAEVKNRIAAPEAALQTWDRSAKGLAIAIALFLLFDVFRLPALARRLAKEQTDETSARGPPPQEVALEETISQTPRRPYRNSFINVIETISGWSGNFIAYWSVLAVFVYYYEVLARYVFNSPTNWAHESMFLMFGMQYLLAGAYALREDAHVRVDVLYNYFSDRTKAVLDVLTSVFFFIFTITLFWTGWIFAGDAVRVWEVSFTEWAIQYWPVKIAIPLGAALILMQGIANLMKDVMTFLGREG